MQPPVPAAPAGRLCRTPPCAASNSITSVPTASTRRTAAAVRQAARRAAPTGTVLGFKTLDWSDTLFLNLGAMFALGDSTGFRKAEVALPNDAPFDDRRLRRSSVLWQIDGIIYADPSPDLLSSLVRGRDKAHIKPPRSKADQHGVILGSAPHLGRIQRHRRGGCSAWNWPFPSGADTDSMRHSSSRTGGPLPR